MARIMSNKLRLYPRRISSTTPPPRDTNTLPGVALSSTKGCPIFTVSPGLTKSLNLRSEKDFKSRESRSGRERGSASPPGIKLLIEPCGFPVSGISRPFVIFMCTMDRLKSVFNLSEKLLKKIVFVKERTIFFDRLHAKIA